MGQTKTLKLTNIILREKPLTVSSTLPHGANRTYWEVQVDYEGFGQIHNFSSAERLNKYLKDLPLTKTEYVPSVEEITGNGRYTCD